MPSRDTTKIRAKRIELHYFKRLYPFRRWKLILTIAAPVLAGGWLLAMAALGDNRIYNSGPVSTAHAMFGVQCAQCHVPGRGDAGKPTGLGFWLRAADHACLKCHDGPVHHDNQEMPGTDLRAGRTCASCHTEHKGRPVLASMRSEHCTQCHADLKTKGPETGYTPHIRSFADGHPQFAVDVKDGPRVVRSRLDDATPPRDLAQVKLNHQKHLKPGLRFIDQLKERQGMRGLLDTPRGLQLSCTFCHRPDDQQLYMAPIDYNRHCGPACHELDFGFPDKIAPHDKPAVVGEFLRVTYSEAFDACQALLRQPPEKPPAELKARCQALKLVKGPPAEPAEESDRPRARLGRREEPADEERPRARPRLAEEDKPVSADWIPAQVKQAESLLFKKKCAECHTVSYAPERLPEVAPTCIPKRWLSHSRFDHGAHRPLACTECHDRALRSSATADVLLPPIAICRTCHRESRGARADCVECHRYHDRAKARDLSAPFTIRELVTGAPDRSGPAGPMPMRGDGPC